LITHHLDWWKARRLDRWKVHLLVRRSIPRRDRYCKVRRIRCSRYMGRWPLEIERSLRQRFASDRFVSALRRRSCSHCIRKYAPLPYPVTPKSLSRNGGKAIAGLQPNAITATVTYWQTRFIWIVVARSMIDRRLWGTWLLPANDCLSKYLRVSSDRNIWRCGPTYLGSDTRRSFAHTTPSGR
jgi:hypothetical protein